MTGLKDISSNLYSHAFYYLIEVCKKIKMILYTRELLNQNEEQWCNFTKYYFFKNFDCDIEKLFFL
ncbi:hypothetical protein BOQ01_02130 [Campylobacter coli]|nr:hypothetical protein BOQ01_02130 [Campylobacter coli]